MQDALDSLHTALYDIHQTIGTSEPGVVLEFLVVGLNHRTAPLEVREKLAVTRSELLEALTVMGRYVGQGVILCTCNRSEVYTFGEARQLKGKLEEFLRDYFDIAPEDFSSYFYTHHQERCIHHLFRVTSSLDSMILGEGQILRQVKVASEAGLKAGLVRGPLSRLFNQALRVGKRVRRETNISRNALSVSRACVELARRRLAELRDLTVLVIGTGDAGKLAARALKESSVKQIVVTNRTFRRAQDLAQELGGVAIAFQDMAEALKDVDIVIGSTGSPGYILQPRAVEEAMVGRPDRPMFLIDIAVPRDFHPDTAHVGNVYLYDMDDLETVSEANRLEREREAQWAEEIAAEEVGRFLEWLGTLEAIPTITAMQKWAEEIRNKELAKALRKLDHTPTPQDMESLEAMTRAIVKKILHNPIASLKGNLSSGEIRLARDMFDVDGQPPQTPAAQGLKGVPGDGE